MRHDRRLLVQGGLSAVAASALPSALAPAARYDTPEPRVAEINLSQLGPPGGGATDDTQAFHRALSLASRVVVPPGTYRVRSIEVPAGRMLATSGPGTVLRQIPAQPNPTPIVRVTGSRTMVGSFTAEGNIGSDSGEWMHAVQVIANRRTGDISDVVIGNIFGRNLRGDVLYLSAREGSALSRIRAGNISGDNIYRNVVSITGTSPRGGSIRIENVAGIRVGLFHFDIEPDVGAGPANGISLGSIRGRNVSISGQTGRDFVAAVTIDTIDLDPSYSGTSEPDYPNVRFARPVALQLRNAVGIKIGSLRCRGFAGQAVKFVDSDLTAMSLDVGLCDIADCARTDPEYGAYILGAGSAARLRIRELRADIGPSRSGLMLYTACNVDRATVRLSPGARLLNDCSNAQLSSLRVVGPAATLAANTSGASFTGGSIAVATLGNNCDELRFENITASGRFVGGSPRQTHRLVKARLNGTFHEAAVHRPSAI